MVQEELGMFKDMVKEKTHNRHQQAKKLSVKLAKKELTRQQLDHQVGQHKQLESKRLLVVKDQSKSVRKQVGSSKKKKPDI